MTYDELVRQLIVERQTIVPPFTHPDDTPEQQEARRQALGEAINGWQSTEPATAQQRLNAKQRRHLRRIA